MTRGAARRHCVEEKSEWMLGASRVVTPIARNLCLLSMADYLGCYHKIRYRSDGKLYYYSFGPRPRSPSSQITFIGWRPAVVLFWRFLHIDTDKPFASVGRLAS